MQSGGQGAGIQLQVGLDLAYFRSQLPLLSKEAAGHLLTFGVRFNRQDIVTQFKTLDRYVNNKKFNIEIKSNLKAEIKAANELAKLLQSMPAGKPGTPGAIYSRTAGTEVRTAALNKLLRSPGSGGFNATQITKLAEAAIKAGIEGIDINTSATKLRSTLRDAFQQAGDDSSRGLINALIDGRTAVGKAAAGLAEETLNTLRTSLQTQSPSKKTEKIGRDVGKGFEIGALSSMDQAFDALENKMRQRGKILDTVARGIFRMLGMDPAAMLQQAREQRATPVRTPIAGLLPSFTSRGTREETIRQLTGGGPSVAQGPGMLALSNEALGRRVNAILQEYFKVAEVQVRESFDPRELKRSLNVFSYIAQSLRDAESRTKQARVAESVDSLMQAIDNAVKIAQARVRVSRVQVAELGPRAQGALSAGRVAGLLPAATGRTPSPYSTGRVGGETQAELFARREREARMRSALREMDVMGGSAGRPASPYSYANRAARPRSAMVPYSAGGALVPIGGGTGGAVPPRPPSGGGGGGMGGTGSFGRALGGINLPGTGVVREIGNEFAMATKQVLLFGTAYKALAFITSFPAQVGQAVGALQSFNNTLKAISPTAEEARASNQFILDIVDRYNVPLQSARDGFTKLYASMAPAGFQGDEIRALFTGVSQAAATFGMSADKVDRVNYAFAQMASKGQVMSEELKGQLGDVLPGAMGIFAEAAGFKGPDAIQKFSKALEDGAYKGEAMRGLLKNVTVVLTKEFGPGAEGAARTFQGVINRMQNSTKLLYEAFEPVAVGFLNSVVVPLTSGIKTISDGFNAFFKGTQAQTTGGSALAQQLNALKPSFEGISRNVKELLPTFQLLGSVLLNVAKAFAVIAGNPVVGFLVKLYANVLLVNTVFTLLGGKILVSLVGGINAAIARFVALNVAVATMQKTTIVANSTLAGTQLQMALLQKSAGMATGPVNILRNALLSIANIGIIAIGINVVINGLSELDRLKKSLAEIGTFSSAKYRQEVSTMAKENVNSAIIENRKTQKAIQKELGQYAGPVGGARGLVTGRDEELRARLLMVQVKEQELIRANKTAKTKVSLQSQVTGGLVPIEGAGAEGKGGGGSKASKAAKERESQIPQLMLRLEKTRELAALELQITNATLTNNTAQISSLELAKQLVEFKYEAKELDLQDLTTAEKAIAKREIALRTEQVILDSQLQLQIDLRKERDAIQQGFSKILEGYEEESGYQQMYLKLIDQGIRPALAKARVEVEKSFKEQEKQLDASIALNKENIAATEITIEQFKLQKNLSEESKKQLADAERRLEILKEELGLREGIKAGVPDAKGRAAEEAEKGLMPKTPGEYIGEGLEAAEDRLKELTNTGYQVVEAANAIGDAFGTAFKGVLTGSMTAREALAGFFQSVADHFADMVSQMIAEWLKAQLIKGFMSLFPGGSALSGATSAASTGLSFDPGGMASFSAPWTFATGGIAPGGFRAFANGGIVTGPTLGLVGEGRYNEAVIPLPDGRSVPVELSGGGSSSPTVIVNVDAKGSQVEGNEQNANQLGRVISAAVQTELIKQQRPGGLLASRR